MLTHLVFSLRALTQLLELTIFSMLTKIGERSANRAAKLFYSSQSVVSVISPFLFVPSSHGNRGHASFHVEVRQSLRTDDRA